MNAKLKFFLDMAPLAAFFIGYKYADLFVATALIMAATIGALIITYVMEKKLALNPLITGGMVMVFGGLTLLLQDETFIKMKPTIINSLLSAVLIGGAVLYKKGLLRYLLEMAFEMPDRAWQILSLRWGLFFMFLAVLNEVIWRNFSTEFWVDFKVFGMLTCTIVFSISQFPFVKKHMVQSGS